MCCNIKAVAIYLPLSRCCCSHKANLLSPPGETSKIKVAHVPFQIGFFPVQRQTPSGNQNAYYARNHTMEEHLWFGCCCHRHVFQRRFPPPFLFYSYWFIICAFVILFLLLLLFSASSQWIFIFPLTHLYLNFLISCLFFFLFISVAWWFDHAVEYRISNLRVLGYCSRTPVQQRAVFFPILTPSSVAKRAEQQ